MAELVLIVCCSLVFPADTDTANISRVFDAGEHPDDARLTPPRMLNDEYHPWTPPTTKDEWEREAAAIRQQILVSANLWPMPPKAPLEPVIHGKVDRGDYTVEQVYFASHPGHYVTGQLYRPKQVDANQRFPGVLCPYGHWSDGRFHDAGEARAKKAIEKGAETFLSVARYPLQARMVQLARMGCVVFHYDSVGHADSQPIGHRSSFRGPRDSLWLQNVFGVQLFNSICALDFITSLPDVDPNRIGVTGASGGGSQTIILGAIDPRPTVAFPAVMVSTNMQGGCYCENGDYLRIGINNVAIAATFAPKPMAMSGANDWTRDIESRGLPELKHVYSLYGKDELVRANAFLEFEHSFNQPMRELMYNWFNKHLKLGLPTPVVQSDFEPIPPDQLSVWDDAHPLPADTKDEEQLRDYLTEVAQQQLADLLPPKAKDLNEYRRVVGGAARVMLASPVPMDESVERTQTTHTLDSGVSLRKGLMGRADSGEQIPYVELVPKEFRGTTVLWLDGQGKSHLFDADGHPVPAVNKLLEQGYSVASADLFLTGEFPESVPKGEGPDLATVVGVYPGFMFGYNRPLLSNRVRDIFTVMAGLRQSDDTKSIDLVGTGDAGVWALLASALAGETVAKTVVDLGGFSFQKLVDGTEPNFLPGALKYGGIGGLAALAAPGMLVVRGTDGIPSDEIKPLQDAYAATKGQLDLHGEPLKPETIVRVLLK